MENISKEVIKVNIEDEIRHSYLDYAMSVIIGRALPDMRDGLKPVHRRILYAMYREGLLSSKSFSKCAGVVGEVLKKYHPHGDSAVYDSLVRLAQNWNLRYPLVNGQGNFGSIDGDPAAAYRYTEAKLQRLAEEMLDEIDKETVDFVPNFDNSTVEPVVLPTRIPNILINGSDGIAVGMATKIPPHNLKEVIDILMDLADNPDLTIRDIMKKVPGPDFPTGGFIDGRDGIVKAYETGKGIIYLRAKAYVESIARGDREQIVVTEIPYQVNKSKLLEQIAQLVNKGKLQGISDLRDESDRDGMRVVIELKRGSVAGVIMNQLYKHTSMQTSFGIIMLGIVGGQPRLLTIKEILQIFIDYRKEIVTRRTAYDLRQALARAHILEGLKIAVENIDEVIAMIKKSKEPESARIALIKRFKLSEIQAKAILEMRLQRLTGLERQKLIDEYLELMKEIELLKAILADEKKVLKIIKDELQDVRARYGDERRTIIQGKSEDLSVEDLIQEEEMVVTVSHGGYVKRNPISIYRAQRRGGRGKSGMSVREDDFVEKLFVASTHTYLLIFITSGRVFWLKVHEIPEFGRTARGQSITNLIRISSDEKVAAILPVAEFVENQFVVMATKKGVIKKTELMSFSNPRVGGIIAATIDEGDEVISAHITDDQHQIFIATRDGQSIRFPQNNIRPMGRAARGVRGINLKKDDLVVAMETINSEAALLTVTEKGYGKRSEANDYRVQSRGGSGIKTIKVSDKNGPVVGVLQVMDTDEIMLVTDQGVVIRSPVNQISVQGRSTQGVRLISLDEGQKVVSVARLAERDGEEG
ncbi:MAG: DNA gyrase subunit A [Pseudomonadota bacterium]